MQHCLVIQQGTDVVVGLERATCGKGKGNGSVSGGGPWRRGQHEGP